jgi:hypothetical protein
MLLDSSATEEMPLLPVLLLNCISVNAAADLSLLACWITILWLSSITLHCPLVNAVAVLACLLLTSRHLKMTGSATALSPAGQQSGCRKQC